jgi:hypothetical protein
MFGPAIFGGAFFPDPLNNPVAAESIYTFCFMLGKHELGPILFTLAPETDVAP